MNTILSPFRIRLTAFQLADALVTPDFGNLLPTVKMLVARVFDCKKVNGPERPRRVPVENLHNGQEETFEVSIKLVRKVVRPEKTPKGSSRAATERAQPYRNQTGDSAL